MARLINCIKMEGTEHWGSGCGGGYRFQLVDLPGRYESRVSSCLHSPGLAGRLSESRWRAEMKLGVVATLAELQRVVKGGKEGRNRRSPEQNLLVAAEG